MNRSPARLETLTAEIAGIETSSAHRRLRSRRKALEGRLKTAAKGYFGLRRTRLASEHNLLSLAVNDLQDQYAALEAKLRQKESALQLCTAKHQMWFFLKKDRPPENEFEIDHCVRTALTEVAGND